MPPLIRQLSFRAWEKLNEGGEGGAEGGVVVPAQARGQEGAALVEGNIVFHIDGKIILTAFAAAAGAGKPRDVAVGLHGLLHRGGIVEHGAATFRTHGEGVATQRQIGTAAEAVVFQNAVGKAGGVVVGTFSAAKQSFWQAAVYGFVEADVAFQITPFPVAVVSQGVALAVEAGSFRADKREGNVAYGRNEYVTALGVAVVDIALAAVGGIESEALGGADVPLQAAGDVAVAHAFAAGAEGSAGVYAVVDVEIIGAGFVEVAVEAEAKCVFYDGAGHDEVGTAGGALICAALRLFDISAHAAVEFAGDGFGADVYHATHRAGAVAGSGRAAQHFDFFNHFGRYPVGVTARVAHAAAAVAFGIARAHGFAVDQNQCVFRAHGADVDLAFVAACATGRVGAESNAQHFADDFGDVVGNGHLLQVLRGNHRYAELLFGLAFGGNVDGLQFAVVGGFGIIAGIGSGAGGNQQQGAEHIEFEQSGFHGLRFPV